MVRKNQNKKRRSASRKPTRIKHKNNTNQRWEKNPTFHDDVIRQKWDVSKSPSWNMANMGLRASPNNEDDKKILKQQQQQQSSSSSSHQEKFDRSSRSGKSCSSSNNNNNNNNVIELYDIPDSDTLAEQSRLKKKYKYPLSEEEQRYIVTIMDKYRVVPVATTKSSTTERAAIAASSSSSSTTTTTTEQYDYDYETASRDHKLNYMQHSEGQLKKLAARYQLLDEEQRVV